MQGCGSGCMPLQPMIIYEKPWAKIVFTALNFDSSCSVHTISMTVFYPLLGMCLQAAANTRQSGLPSADGLNQKTETSGIAASSYNNTGTIQKVNL
jgi:hypothetical protein